MSGEVIEIYITYCITSMVSPLHHFGGKIKKLCQNEGQTLKFWLPHPDSYVSIYKYFQIKLL